MKAMILAAGLGTRLGFVDIPKPMYEIEGKPVLEHNILLLKKHGIKNICINLHYLPEVIKDYFQNGKKWDVEIKYSFEKDLLGTSGAVKNVKSFWNDGPFFVVYGDNFTNINFTEMFNFHKSCKALATIALFDPVKVVNSGIAGSYVEMDKNNRLVSFIEGQGIKKNGYVNAGVYILEPEILDMIPDNTPSDFGRDIFPKILSSGYLINGYLTSSFVFAFDTKDALEATNKHVGNKEKK